MSPAPPPPPPAEVSDAKSYIAPAPPPPEPLIVNVKPVLGGIKYCPEDDTIVPVPNIEYMEVFGIAVYVCLELILNIWKIIFQNNFQLIILRNSKIDLNLFGKFIYDILKYFKI
jgi:hypothetical protein